MADIGLGEGDREVAGIGPGWAVGRWEEGTAPEVARQGVGSSDSGFGMDYWNSGEGTGSVNLLGSGTCGA